MIRTSVQFVRGSVIALALGLAPAAPPPAHAAAPAQAVAAKKGPAKATAAKKASANAAAAEKKPEASIEERASNLKPGHWVWKPEVAPEGEIDIVVSIPLQLAYVFRGGTLIGATTVSTGAPGYDTPTGRYAILQKREKHFSNLYDSAPMPYMQRLTWDGIALHGGAIPGHPASHGCVRLPHKFAAKLFEATQLGANVMIVDEAPGAEAAYAMATGKTFDSAMGGPEEPVAESPALAEVRRTLEGLASGSE